MLDGVNVQNDPVNSVDPEGLFKSPWYLQWVPGQAAWDYALTSLEDGNYLGFGLGTASMLGQQALFALTSGYNPSVSSCNISSSGAELDTGLSSNLARFQKNLPNGAKTTEIYDLPLGGKAFQSEVPGRVPGSYAIYEKQADSAGNTLLYTKTTVGPDGTIIHVKQKFP